jgi:hypothetical protein
MGNKMIIGKQTQELKLGYAVNVNQNDVRRFTAYAGDVPVKDIPFGDILILGGATKVYKSASNEDVATVTAESQVVGVALSTNVKLNTFFPVGTSTAGNAGFYTGGDDGNNLIKGEVAVQYFGAAPAENGIVYIITDTTVSGEPTRLGKLTGTTALDGDTTVALTKFSWSGITEASEGLSVVKLDLQS